MFVCPPAVSGHLSGLSQKHLCALLLGECTPNLFLTEAAQSRLCRRNFPRQKSKANWISSQNKHLIMVCKSSEHDESAREWRHRGRGVEIKKTQA